MRVQRRRQPPGRLRAERIFVHAVAIFGRDRRKRDAETLQSADEFGEEGLKILRAHQRIVDVALSPRFQVAVSTGPHLLFVDLEDAEFIFQRELHLIAEASRTFFLACDDAAHVERIAPAGDLEGIDDGRDPFRCPGMLAYRRGVDKAAHIGKAVRLVGDGGGEERFQQRRAFAGCATEEVAVYRLALRRNLEGCDLGAETAIDVGKVDLDELRTLFAE